MDWKTWMAVGLSIIGIAVWQIFYANKVGQVPPPPAPQVMASQSAETASLQLASTEQKKSSSGPSINQQRETLEAADVHFTFLNDLGGIDEVGLVLHQGPGQVPLTLNHESPIPIGALERRPGEAEGGFEMRVDRALRQVIFEKVDDDGMLIRKTFQLPTSDAVNDKYLVSLRVDFTNRSANVLQRLGYFVSVGSAAPVHSNDMPLYTRFDWYRGGSMESIDVGWFSASKIPFIGIQTRPARSIYKESSDHIPWAAVASQYFCTILMAKGETYGTSVWAERFDVHLRKDKEVHGIRGSLGLPGFEVRPGETVSSTFSIFAGPKELALLKRLGNGQQEIMRFGMFKWVSEFLLWAMNSLERFLGNYAWAIIVLTLFIKLVLWPVQNKATNSMRRMAALSPKMTELREKYRDDPQRMNQELMKLYRDYGINPFSGCLPMLIQIPIFFGFYSMLGIAIELRGASFLWIRDLSQPDTVAHVLSFPINLLPLIMAATMVWQMVITPKTGDAVQQRVFYFMPVIFLVFCYNFASALALYWTTQNIFSIIQLYLTRNKPLPTLEKVKPTIKRNALDKPKKKNGKGARK